MNYKTASTTCTGYSQPSFMTRTDTSGENDYEYVDDIKLPPPPPISAGSTFGKAVSPPGSVCAAHGTNTLNQYGFDGTPNFAKMRALQQPGPVHLVHQMPPTGTPIFPQYYELDPDSPKEAGPKPPQTQSSAFVSRAFSEENSENVAKPTRQNMNFGHYSQWFFIYVQNCFLMSLWDYSPFEFFLPWLVCIALFYTFDPFFSAVVLTALWFES